MAMEKPQKTAISQLALPERILLGPGPSLADPRVLQAMTTPLLGHLDPAFLGLMDRIQELLRYVFETSNRLTIPISGTGSAAMEAAVANMVEPGDKVLVCSNGYFSLRIAEMARRYGGDPRAIYYGPDGKPSSTRDDLHETHLPEHPRSGGGHHQRHARRGADRGRTGWRSSVTCRRTARGVLRTPWWGRGTADG